MYAVVDNGGKQYRVEPGTTVVVDRMDAEAGASVVFERVLLIGDEDGLTIGTPTVAGALVRGTVIAQGRGPKIVVFHFRPKAHYRRRTGARAELTQIRIDEIAVPGARKRTEKAAIDEPATEAAASTAKAPVRKPAARASATTKDAGEPATRKPAARRKATPAREN
jgi:large subunit ribosomal protein L21